MRQRLHPPRPEVEISWNIHSKVNFVAFLLPAGSEALSDAESLVVASGSTVAVWLGTASLDPTAGSPWGIVSGSF